MSAIIKRTSLAVLIAACLSTAATAHAATATIYGRVDAGLRYTNVHHGSDSLTLATSRAHNRVGLNIAEDLGNGMKVKGYLENGFTIDDGQMDTEGQLFNRRSILSVVGNFGEFAMGRMGTVQSTVAPFTMGLIKYDPFATSYGQSSIGTTFANTSRVNNALTWVSPKYNGWKVGATYSLGNTVDDEDWSDYQDRDHTLALATDYTGANLYLSFSYANVAWGDVNQSDATKAAAMSSDAHLFGFGGWYRWLPQSKIYWGAQYARHWSSAASFSSSKLIKDAKYSHAAKINDEKGGFNGYSLLLGSDWMHGAHKIITDVQFYDGNLARNHDWDLRMTVLSAAYEYKFAKKVWGYVAANTSFSSGKVADLPTYTSEQTQVMIGINYNF